VCFLGTELSRSIGPLRYSAPEKSHSANIPHRHTWLGLCALHWLPPEGRQITSDLFPLTPSKWKSCCDWWSISQSSCFLLLTVADDLVTALSLNTNKNKTNSAAFSPQANYTNWSAAAWSLNTHIESCYCWFQLMILLTLCTILNNYVAIFKM
jgi:hypothetical protein